MPVLGGQRSVDEGADPVRNAYEAVEQRDAVDGAFGGMVARSDMPSRARAGQDGRGHRFAADPEAVWRT
jgi:hypothetical protein